MGLKFNRLSQWLKNSGLNPFPHRTGMDQLTTSKENGVILIKAELQANFKLRDSSTPLPPTESRPCFVGMIFVPSPCVRQRKVWQKTPQKFQSIQWLVTVRDVHKSRQSSRED